MSTKPRLTYRGYEYFVYDEQDDDVIKKWHFIQAPDAEEVTPINWYTPYREIPAGQFLKFVWFHQTHGRFPARADTTDVGGQFGADFIIEIDDPMPIESIPGYREEA